MGSVPVYATSSSDERTTGGSRRSVGVAQPSRTLILTEATPIVLRPEERQVMIGNQLLPASRIVECDEQDVEREGRIGFFTVQGKRWTYDVDVFVDRVEVQKWYTEIDDECPSYGGDAFELTRAGQCARFMVEELIPDCLAALEG